jgi:hypothetical protein
MALSRLSRILNLFLKSDTPLSLGYIAYQLEISPDLAESMLEYWIRRGRIKVAAEEINCGSCGINQSCPYVDQLPVSYSLVNPQ